MKQGYASNDRVSLTLGDQGVAHVRLTRADQRNALDAAMVAALLDAGGALFDQPGLRCVVLSGEGSSFCAGLDRATIEGALADQGLNLAERSHGNANRFQQLALQWRKLPVPVIAAVQGGCIGGGLQIAGGADIRIVAPDARLAVMEMRWGLVPDMGGFALWRGLVREDVLRALTYTNREFSGEEALALGFATELAADPLARALALADEIATRSPTAIRAAKALFARAWDAPLGEILQEESYAQQRLLGSRNQVEAVRSQMERSPPLFTDP